MALWFNLVVPNPVKQILHGNSSRLVQRTGSNMIQWLRFHFLEIIASVGIQVFSGIQSPYKYQQPKDQNWN